jgi:acetoacetyl-CoA reductase/3-oxoacyl-[acyl-carrier protein] reductase
MEGQTALVTGGAGGIGSAIVRSFHEQGAVVCILDREPPPGGPGFFFKVDVTRPEEVNAAVARIVQDYGTLDSVIAAHGIRRDGVFWKLTTEDWSSVLAANLDGSFHLLKAVTPHLRSAGKGSIVFLSSINGERGKFGQANYCASKAGVIALARSAAREVGRFGVRVNVVAPGMIDTSMTRSLPTSVLEDSVRESALERIGMPEEVASVTLLLCSDMTSFVTGQVIRVDGGQLMG